MSNTLVVVNGEEYWAEHFSEYEVYRIRLQTSRWMLRDGLLWVYDAVLGKRIRVDSLFWRIGAVRPFPHHREALELASGGTRAGALRASSLRQLR
jgi:ribosomal protein S6--L-glutamate ligase